MESTREARRPSLGDMLERLGRLEARVDDISVRFAPVAIASYPGGVRPSSVVTVCGGGLRGVGEHVGWDRSEHLAFERNAADVDHAARTLGEWSARLAGMPPYDRAALEAALVDLALRQHETSLSALSGRTAGPVRYAVSFARSTDPVAEAKRLGTGKLPLKVDADPSWSEATWRELAALGTVAVVDFKLDGDAADHERAHRHLPDAWIEDPKPSRDAWSPGLRLRWSSDAAVTGTSTLAAMDVRPAAVNVKPARMGGVLEALACLAYAESAGITTYIGGMFEAGPGRGQLCALAAVACPDGPNDIAPLDGGAWPPALTAEIPTGFTPVSRGARSDEEGVA